MSLVERLLVPAAKSSASTSAVFRPRVAASSAAPAPVAPPGAQSAATAAEQPLRAAHLQSPARRSRRGEAAPAVRREALRPVACQRPTANVSPRAPVCPPQSESPAPPPRLWQLRPRRHRPAPGDGTFFEPERPPRNRSQPLRHLPFLLSRHARCRHSPRRRRRLRCHQIRKYSAARSSSANLRSSNVRSFGSR